jgi:hypothetical protein
MKIGMKNRYRIKVEERINGDVLYIPQVGHSKLTTSVYCYLFTEWYNITDERNHSKNLSVSYRFENAARQLIENYKNQLSIEEGKEVKSVRYIDID